jgi:S1-C subfamily serine protease
MFYRIFNLCLIFIFMVTASCTPQITPREALASTDVSEPPINLHDMFFPEVQNVASFYDVTTYNTFAHRISRNSAVRVQIDYGGALIGGSGTYFKWKGHNMVITAAHLYAFGGGSELVDEAVITTPREKVIGKLVYMDKYVDIAIFAVPELESRKAAKFNRADGYEIGEPTVYSGFPGPNNLLTFDGTMSGEGYNTDIAMHSFAWPGSSGSGVFNSDGEFLGVVVSIMVGGGPSGKQLIGSVVYVAPAALIDSAYLLQNLRKLKERPNHGF